VRDKMVLDSNPAAIARGILPGMEQRQAANLIQGCTFRIWDREAFVERQNEWLDICAEFTGIVEPVDQHIAAIDLSGHPHRVETAEKLVRLLIDKMHLPLEYGAAASKWVAELASHYLNSEIATRDPAAFLAPLPVSNLLPVSPEHRQRLDFLGYRKIGQVAKVPIQTLRDQFGEEGLTIAQAAQGGVSEPVRAMYPLGSLRECFLFESPVEDLETIRLTRNLLAARLTERLDGRQSSLAILEIEREDGSLERKERPFTKAIYNSLTANSALRLLLPDEPIAEENITKQTQAIVALRVTLQQLQPVRQRQHQLIETNSRPAAESAVRYVNSTFGDQAVRLGAEIIPPRRERVLREWRNATGWY